MRLTSLCLCLASPVTSLPAQSAFVTVSRGDTVLVERFTRTSTRLDGDVTPKGSVRMVYGSAIDATGHLGAMTLAIFAPGAAAGAPPMQQVQMSVVGDSAMAMITAGSAPPRAQNIASRAGAQPILNQSFAVYEVLIAAARRRHVADTSQTRRNRHRLCVVDHRWFDAACDSRRSLD